MAMRKTDKPTPGTGAPQRKYNTVGPSKTPSKTPVGRRPTKPVVKVQPKGAIKKSAVKNPKAPKAIGSGTSVKVITKSETAMKKGTAGRNRSGGTAGGTEKDYRRGMYITGPGKSTKYVTGKDNSLKGVALTYNELKEQDKKMKSTQSKGRGGMGGGGLVGGGAIRKSK